MILVMAHFPGVYQLGATALEFHLNPISYRSTDGAGGSY